MKPPQPRRKCLQCKELFLPDYRGGQRQCYCLQPDCRKARKRDLMRAWLAKPENQNYFRDDQNAQRARDRQKEHPGYWKNTARYRRRTLQDGCSGQVPAVQEVEKTAPDRTLQDLCSLQVPLFVGLISMFVGSTLPDDIATSTRRLVSKGHDILGIVPGMNLERLLHEKTCPQSGATPESPAPVSVGPNAQARPKLGTRLIHARNESPQCFGRAGLQARMRLIWRFPARDRPMRQFRRRRRPLDSRLKTGEAIFLDTFFWRIPSNVV